MNEIWIKPEVEREAYIKMVGEGLPALCTVSSSGEARFHHRFETVRKRRLPVTV